MDYRGRLACPPSLVLALLVLLKYVGIQLPPNMLDYNSHQLERPLSKLDHVEGDPNRVPPAVSSWGKTALNEWGKNSMQGGGPQWYTF